MLIFEQSEDGRQASAQAPKISQRTHMIAPQFLRTHPARWPQCSELQVVRHFTRLSQKNFSIDTNFYPLGSCTMKYNPRGMHKAATLAAFINRHPLTPANQSQGLLHALYNLQIYLADITGFAAVALSPMAGAQGEFAGVAIIKAYHQARGDFLRDEIIIPDAAHGTNPASAMMCGFKVIEIATDDDGELNMHELHRKVSPRTAGIMLTNPSTLGLFMRQIQEISTLIHNVGGLLYYDGANLNAILGKVRPGDMGFDIMHLNLHKTFATPHGGGGPGAGPVAVCKNLIDFLAIPRVLKEHDHYRWATYKDYPFSIGRLSCFMGNIGILLRAYFYICVLGNKGLVRVSQYATLNANYLLTQLTRQGFSPAYPGRRASHEFLLTLRLEKKNYGIGAGDFAKNLLDHQIHAPTTYFPLLVPECLLIEPTETECKAELDNFIAIMGSILHIARTKPKLLTQAPYKLATKRLDELKAARELDLNYFYTDVLEYD